MIVYVNLNKDVKRKHLFAPDLKNKYPILPLKRQSRLQQTTNFVTSVLILKKIRYDIL